jgi:cell division protein ZapE
LSISVLDRYLDLVRRGEIGRDPAQECVVRKLDDLRQRLGDGAAAHRSGLIGWLFGRGQGDPPPRGLYLWGGVGRGKTMLMDLFFEAAPTTRKRRIHFHAFMADVHARIHAWRQATTNGAGGNDPVAPVAAALADDARLLCLDEFAVTDIADAMLLGRLFEALFSRGLVMVATSNVAPRDLYRDGLNRALFLPFVALLEERMDVVHLDARTDFRLEKLAGEPVYLVPADAAARRALDRTFRSLTGRDRGEPARIELLGRTLTVPQAVAGVARFSFADLCVRPLGPADYLALARRFHTVLVDEIPVLRPEQRNEARRLILLIDTLYDSRVKLVASAQAEPGALFTAVEGAEAFEFRRTVSRLIEMQARDYLALPHGRTRPAAPPLPNGQAGIAERSGLG